jgi:hypothetical protein
MSAKIVPTFADTGCRVAIAMDPPAVNLGFIDTEPLLFHSSSTSVILTRLNDPVPDPVLLRISGSAGNRTLFSGSVVRNSGD